jgi:hypothetical protein
MSAPYPNEITNDLQLRELAMAIARNRAGPNDPIEEVLAACAVSPNDFLRIADDKVFKGYVTAYAKELTENGYSFAAKCRVLAENAIEDLYYLAKDAEMPAAARVKAVENLVDWGGLAPKNSSAVDAGRPTFSISINLPASVTGTTQPITITGTHAPALPDDPADTDPIEAEVRADLQGMFALIDGPDHYDEEAYQ